MADESTNSTLPETCAESAQAPVPPPELTAYVAALSPENLEKARAESDALNNPIAGWEGIIERMGLEDAVEVVGSPNDPPRALAIVLSQLPISVCHEYSRQFPSEVIGLAGVMEERFKEQGRPDSMDIACELVAPEVLDAFYWVLENQTAALMKATGFGSLLN